LNLHVEVLAVSCCHHYIHPQRYYTPWSIYVSTFRTVPGTRYRVFLVAMIWLGETFNFQSNPEPSRTQQNTNFAKRTSSGSQQDKRKDEHDGYRKRWSVILASRRASDGVWFFKKAL
jgi:hypothetical protein